MIHPFDHLRCMLAKHGWWVVKPVCVSQLLSMDRGSWSFSTEINSSKMGACRHVRFHFLWFHVLVFLTSVSVCSTCSSDQRCFSLIRLRRWPSLRFLSLLGLSFSDNGDHESAPSQQPLSRRKLHDKMAKAMVKKTSSEQHGNTARNVDLGGDGN